MPEPATQTPATPNSSGAQPQSVPPHTHKHTHSTEIHEVTFTAYPKYLFVWPVILAGFLFYPLALGLNEGALEVLGWVYITIVSLVFVSQGIDVNRNQAIFWGVLIFALWILGLYLDQVKNIPVFGSILGWLGNINVQYNGAMGVALSIVLTIPYLIMIVYAKLNDRWRITHNEFEHYAFGKQDDSLGRGAKTIRTEFPDVFEMLFGMAGTLIVYNASGNQELRRIPHVLFLPMIRKRLNKVLETVATSVSASAAAEEEETNLG